MGALSVVVGSFYAFLSICLFLVNLCVFIITLRFKEYSTVTYRLIKNMCFACLLQLIVFFVGALMTLYEHNFNATFERICGAVVQSMWLLYLSLSLSLAIDRMLMFLWKHLSVFVSNFLLALSWAHALAHFTLLLFPGFSITYCKGKQRGCYLWDYDEQEGSEVLDDIYRYVLLSMGGCALICYLAVLYRLFKMRSMSESSKISSYSTELRILIVAVVSFLYEAALVILLFWERRYSEEDGKPEFH